MTLELLIPNENPFEFLKRMVLPAAPVCVPAATRLAGVQLAVIVEPFRPKEIPFEFENVTALRLFEVVPAEMLKL